jgi:hypothetical protein
MKSCDECGAPYWIIHKPICSQNIGTAYHREVLLHKWAQLYRRHHQTIVETQTIVIIGSGPSKTTNIPLGLKLAINHSWHNEGGYIKPDMLFAMDSVCFDCPLCKDVCCDKVFAKPQEEYPIPGIIWYPTHKGSRYDWPQKIGDILPCCGNSGLTAIGFADMLLYEACCPKPIIHCTGLDFDRIPYENNFTNWNRYRYRRDINAKLIGVPDAPEY